MKQPQSKKVVLDWIFNNGNSWFRPRKAINEIKLNSSLTYKTLKTFHKKKILIKSVTIIGKQNRIKYKLNNEFITNLLYDIIDSLELMLDKVDPHV